MRRSLAVALAILLLGVTVTVYSPQPVLGQEEDLIRSLSLYWYGEVDQNTNGELNPIIPTASDDTRSECPQNANTDFDGPDNVGDWETATLKRDVLVTGEIFFELWAEADDGQGVDDVVFTLHIFGQEITTESKGVADEPVYFSGTLNLTNNITRPENSQISFTLEYDGNDAYNPLSPDDQVYVLSSSEEHPSRILLNVDYVDVDFVGPKFDFENERVYFNTTIVSAFGMEELSIENHSWDFSVEGEATGFKGSTFCPSQVEFSNEGVIIVNCWYYNLDDTPTDLFYAALEFKDVQGNRYFIQNSESFPLIYTHNLNLNNRISPDGIMVNAKPFIGKVIVDKTITISAKLEAEGDETAQNNPVEYHFYVKKSGNDNETLLKRNVILDLPIGESELVETTWKPTKTGTYTLRIELDRSQYTKETNEDDNGAELVLKVVDEEDTWLQGFQNRLEEDNLALGLLVTLIVGIVAIIVIVIVVKRGGGRRRVGLGEDEWDDDF